MFVKLLVLKMIKYIPFLKFKTNEIKSVAELEQAIRDRIIPLYDIPRTTSIMNEEDIDKRLSIGIKQLIKTQKNTASYPFIIDNFDIDDSIFLAGVPQYRAILKSLYTYPIIPVLAFDRDLDHNIAALDFLKEKNSDIAIRLQQEDIESYSLTKLKINAIWPDIQLAKPRKILLLLDLRIIEDGTEALHYIEKFLSAFIKDFKVSAIVVSGSIIPGNIAGLVSTEEEKSVLREEFRLWSLLKSKPIYDSVLYGDYCVVSPEYSDLDLDPTLMNGVSTPRIFYPYNENFYIVRGRRFKTHGYDQYFDIADLITQQPFYRGPSYSEGDKYIYDRSGLSSKKPSKGGSPSSWIKSLTVAHITFIVNSI